MISFLFHISLKNIWVVLGVEVRASWLLGKCSSTWTIPQPFIFFFVGFAQVGLMLPSSYLYLSSSWDYRYVPLCPAPLKPLSSMLILKYSKVCSSMLLEEYIFTLLETVHLLLYFQSESGNFTLQYSLPF
jgi:hypothetical protein